MKIRQILCVIGALAAALTLILAGCDQPIDGGSNDLITFELTPRPESTTNTIVITFSAEVSVLALSEMQPISGTGSAIINPDSLSGSGTTWEFTVTPTRSGTVNIKIEKEGIDPTPKSVTVTKSEDPPVLLSVVADGGSTAMTVHLTLTFSGAVAGLAKDDITLTGVAGVTPVSLTGSNPYTLTINGFSAGGTLSVSVDSSKAGGSPKTADIYYYVYVPHTNIVHSLRDMTAYLIYASEDVPTVVLQDLTFSDLEKGGDALGGLFEAIYLSDKNAIVDLSAITGNIGDSASLSSYRSSLVGVTLPSTLTRIGNRAFENCDGLTSLTIPANVGSIGSYAFKSTGLGSISIPSSVTSLGNSVFEGCTGLVAVTFPGTPAITTIGSSAFKDCTGLGLNTTITIPSSVTSLGSSAFEGCTNLKTVNFAGNSITTIAEKTFKESKLTGIIIPYSVTSIGQSAFERCLSLGAVAFANGPSSESPMITAIGENAFKDSTLSSIPLPDGVATIGNSAFAGTKLANIAIPYTVTSIGSSAFERCGSTTGMTVTFASSPSDATITTIGDNAFRDSKLGSIIALPNTVTSLGSSAFENCGSLTTVTLGSGVATIKANTFKGSAVTTIEGAPTTSTLSNITSIGSSAFENCTNLTAVTLGNGIRTIESKAFMNTSLGEIAFLNSNPLEIGISAFEDCDALATVAFSEDAKTTINERAFAGSRLTSVICPTISSSSIGIRAFEGCKYLETVDTGPEITQIADYTFKDCTKLTTITIGNKVLAIGVSAFEGCTKLDHVDFNNIATLQNSAFADCTSLNDLKFTSVTQIYNSVFSGCTALADVVLSALNHTIGNNAFAGCINLNNVEFGQPSITNFQDNAFPGANGIGSNALRTAYESESGHAGRYRRTPGGDAWTKH